MYKIASYLLYDNQLSQEYVILHNEQSLPYEIRLALNDSKYLQLSIKDRIDLILEACDISMTPLIEVEEGYFLLDKVSKTHIDGYNGYDIYWNEEVSGINVHEFNFMTLWNVDSQTTSQYAMSEFKANRIKWAREKSFKLLNV